jgi:uncharacterized membrane protein YdfJ with MMPL/SSD domain
VAGARWAPLYLLTAVILEFAATPGAAVLAFQQLGGETGVSFVLPLVLFLFVVALGTDYNLLMTRDYARRCSPASPYTRPWPR